MKIFIALAVILVIHMVATTIRGNIRQQEAEEQSRQEIVERIKNAEGIEDISAGVEFALRETERIHKSGGMTESDVMQEETGVFDSVSTDYGDEIEGFVFYQIPEEYAIYGGYLPEKVQKYIYCLCKQEGVRYALILAMIERESAYRYDRIGDDGASLGYMQIMQKWHEDRMEELGADDLLNPYQNIRVGVDYIGELIEQYGTIQDALTVYNYGAAGAKEHLWSKGIYTYAYNEGIMKRMKEIEEELAR